MNQEIKTNSNEIEYGGFNEKEKFLSWCKEDVLNQIENLDLPFHNREHTIKVMNRVGNIMKIFAKYDLVTREDIVIAKIAALFHDYAQHYSEKAVESERKDENSQDNGTVLMRVRGEIGKSEEESASSIDGFLERFINSDDSESKEVLSYRDKEMIIGMIEGTIPRFEDGTVKHKFDENTPFQVRALMLADLGTAGMSDDKCEFLKDTRNNFFETFVGLKEKISDEHCELSEYQKNFYMEKYKAMILNQPKFIEGLKKQYEEHVKVLPEEARNEMNESLFKYFDANKQKAIEDAKSVKKANTWDKVTEHMKLYIT